jgi:hypothetical protein
MPSDVEVQHTPPVMGNDEETVKNAECECGYSEEIHRGDGLAMVAGKRCPSFGRLRISWRFPHPAEHSSLGNFEAQHLQLTVDARRSPGRVLGNHAEDQVAQFSADRLPSSTNPMPREPRPVQLESGPMPANDGLRLDENQRTLPFRPTPSQDRPEQLVAGRESRLRKFALENAELLSKRQVFQ